MYKILQGSGDTVRMYRLAEPSLITDAIRTKISCVGSNVDSSEVFLGQLDSKISPFIILNVQYCEK